VVFEPDFNNQPMRVQSLDIETEISDQFMKPSVADNRINMITVHDSLTDKFYTWSLQHCDIDFKEAPLDKYPKDKFMLFEFNDSEYKMLEHFIDWLDSNRADVLYGWNIKGYDIPYLYTRLGKVLSRKDADRLSPVGRCYVKEVNHDNARADVAAEIEVNIDGVFQSDGLLLYRDKFKIAGSTLDGGYSLDNVGEYEGLGHKIKYKGSLKDLYVKDWQRFYEYNVRDVDLCKRVDDKCKLTSLARRIASIGLCNYDSIYSSLGYLIGSCVAFAKHKMGGLVFKSYLKERHNFAGFEGAFVFPCIAGIYKDGIGCIDFASLYPSIIRALNISIETYVGKVLIYFKNASGNVTCDPDHEVKFDPFNDGDSEWGEDETGARARVTINAGDPEIDHFELMLPGPQRQRKMLSLSQLRGMIETKCIWTPNNTLFLKHEIKEGVIAKWCEFFYSQRKANKKKELKIFHDLHNEEFVAALKPGEREVLETKMENYHALQMALKICINSIYGATGTSFSPIADPNISQTITRMGRFANMSSAKFVHDEFVRRYGADPNYVTASSGDTDSIFLNLEPVTAWMKKEYSLPPAIKDWRKKDRLELWKTVAEFVDKDVNGFVRGLAHDFCHTSRQDILTYELEYMGDVGIYEKKKHYSIRKFMEEGDPVDKIKYSGIEMKKGSLPKFVKKYLNDIYEGVILHDWKEQDYHAYVTDLYDKFKTFSIDDISFFKGYNTEREADGFLQMAQTVNPLTGKTVGTTGIAKACVYFNQIISKLGLSRKYEQLRVGDKVRLVYLDENNPYRINVIAFKDGQWPAEFDSMFKPDYKKMFEKTVLDSLKSFREACRFSNIDPSKQVMFDIFSL